MQFLAVLVVVALAVKFWWLIAAVVGMFCAAHWILVRSIVTPSVSRPSGAGWPGWWLVLTSSTRG